MFHEQIFKLTAAFYWWLSAGERDNKSKMIASKEKSAVASRDWNRMSNPFQFTKVEKEMMKDDWKKPKKKSNKNRAYNKNNFRKPTVSSRNKKKFSHDLMEFLYVNFIWKRFKTFEFLFLRYGDESSADDKEEEVKEPDHGNESLQSLVNSTRFSFICSMYIL